MNSEDEKKNTKKKTTKKSDTGSVNKKTVKKAKTTGVDEKKNTKKVNDNDKNLEQEKQKEIKIAEEIKEEKGIKEGKQAEELIEEEIVKKEEKLSSEEETKERSKTSKKVMYEDKVKATLLQRFLAYIIDVLLVSFVASLLVFPFVSDDSKIDKLNDEMMEVVEKYQEAKISIKTYATEMESITYQLAKSNGTVTLITLVCEILYFIVFQLYNNGQTIGKKILKIKVVSDNRNLTMNQMICRCLIANSILLEILSFAFMLFAGKTVYFYGVATMEMLQYIVLIVSAFMIMGSLDGRAVHDKLAHTKVIKL